MTSLSGITFKNSLNSVIKSFSQLFFSEKRSVGLLFIIFVGYLSYWALIYAICASIIGNLVTYFFLKSDRYVISIGGVGYNCVIVGLYLTPFILHNFLLGFMTLIFISVLTVLINHYGRLFLHRYGMPPLTLAPIVAIIFTYLAYYFLFHVDIRNQFNVIFDVHYLLIFYIGYMSIYLFTNYKAGIFVLLATLPIYFISFFLRTNMVYLIINIAIVVYAFPGYFMIKHKMGWYTASLCIIPCIILYWLGQILYFYVGIPVLLLPAVFSVWIVCAFLFGKFYQIPLFSAMIESAALLKASFDADKKIIVLTGAGASTLSNIPDYASGQWLNKHIPANYYTFYSFLASRTARKFYFDSCRTFLMLSKHAKPNIIHHVLYTLQRCGLLHSIITQNVDGLLQKAGCKNVIELHGNIHFLECLRCGTKTNWPAEPVWHHHDLQCYECHGLLKPAVKAYQEPLQIEAWEKAITACNTADIVLILGSRLLVKTAQQLVELAQARCAKIIFINDTIIPGRLKEGDVFVRGKLEKILPVISRMIFSKNQ